MFIDEATIIVRSGAGGNGCMSFRREKFVPRGGPDGGDGGRGGDVILSADCRLSTLMDLSRRSLWAAEGGRPGRGANRTGRNGRHLVVPVPVGTVAREVLPDLPPREGRLVADLVRDGETVVVARGGKGGRGNKAFATATFQVPRVAEEGMAGVERKLYLELKLLAEVGLIGLPNAGKSTFLAAISAATPKIADYPFTTLEPHLGIAEIGDYRRLVVADLPGLIEGAHRGQGLGFEFLRHIERTEVLVHLVSVESEDPARVAADYRLVEAELGRYSRPLADKPRLVAASKVDLLAPERRESFCRELERALGTEVQGFSAVTREGVRGLVEKAARLVDERRDGGGARESAR
jgi:GTP-binding protein